MKTKAIYLFIFTCLFETSGFSQSVPKSLDQWIGIGVYTKLNRRLSANLGQVYGFSTSPYQRQYVQSGFSLSYRINNKLRFSSGFRLSPSQRAGVTVYKNRVYGALSLRSKWGYWRVSNSLRFEKHNQVERRYAARLIYSFYIRPKSSIKIIGLKFMPFFSSQLFYNIGGNPISQYNEAGDRVGRYSPEGLHRFRSRLGFYVKPVKRLRFTFYIMMQEEFNTPMATKNYRAINVTNPETGRITRAFNNKYVMGVSLKYYLPRLFRASSQ